MTEMTNIKLNIGDLEKLGRSYINKPVLIEFDGEAVGTVESQGYDYVSEQPLQRGDYTTLYRTPGGYRVGVHHWTGYTDEISYQQLYPNREAGGWIDGEFFSDIEYGIDYESLEDALEEFPELRKIDG